MIIAKRNGKSEVHIEMNIKIFESGLDRVIFVSTSKDTESESHNSYETLKNYMKVFFMLESG